MLETLAGLFIGFTLGWCARVMMHEASTDLELAEIARQMREDFKRNNQHGDAESNGQRPETTLNG